MLARTSLLRAVGVRAGAPALPARSALAGMMACRRQMRFATTESKTAAENIGILNSQREKRPMSPHLAIYEKQLTAGLSIFNRITGVGLSGLLYVGSIAYLLHPSKLYSSLGPSPNRVLVPHANAPRANHRGAPISGDLLPSADPPV